MIVRKYVAYMDRQLEFTALACDAPIARRVTVGKLASSRPVRVRGDSMDWRRDSRRNAAHAKAVNSNQSLVLSKSFLFPSATLS